MQQLKFIFIGLGYITQELVRRISRDIQVSVIEINPLLNESLTRMRKDVRIIKGDATSRLVLEEARVNEADVVLLTTSTEVINLEVARVLKKYFNIKRIIAVGITPGGLKTFQELNVEVENIFTASATGIHNRLDSATLRVHSIGLGREEILEVTVHPNSRMVNLPINSFSPHLWRVGIIYRQDNIVVPTGDTVIKAKDRLIILGQPKAVRTVSEILTFNFKRFPLEYGSTIAAFFTGAEKDGYLKELDYLFSIFPLDKLIIMVSDKKKLDIGLLDKFFSKDNIQRVDIKETKLNFQDAIKKTAEYHKHDLGLIVLSEKSFLKSQGRLGAKKLLAITADNFGCPLLISKESHPYRKIAAPWFDGIGLRRSLETACEVSLALSSSIAALLSTPSKYIAGEEMLRNFENKRRLVSDIGSTYQTSIKPQILSGNPIDALNKALVDYDFFIAEAKALKKQSWPLSLLEPDVLWSVLKKSSVSFMLIPSVDESL